MDKIEKKLEEIAKEYQCLISRDSKGNIIALTEAERSGDMYKRTKKGWWIKKDLKEAIIVPYKKGDKKRNIEIVENYWNKIYEEEGIE